MKLYHHKTDGGAEYLCSSKVEGSENEGSFDSKYIVRIDGDITKAAELLIKVDKQLEPEQFDCVSACPKCGSDNIDWQTVEDDGEIIRQSATCDKCDCEFTETNERKYLYTEID